MKFIPSISEPEIITELHHRIVINGKVHYVDLETWCELRGQQGIINVCDALLGVGEK